jgi:hypothetical protein
MRIPPAITISFFPFSTHLLKVYDKGNSMVKLANWLHWKSHLAGQSYCSINISFAMSDYTVQTTMCTLIDQVSVQRSWYVVATPDDISFFLFLTIDLSHCIFSPPSQIFKIWIAKYQTKNSKHKNWKSGWMIHK